MRLEKDTRYQNAPTRSTTSFYLYRQLMLKLVLEFIKESLVNDKIITIDSKISRK